MHPQCLSMSFKAFPESSLIENCESLCSTLSHAAGVLLTITRSAVALTLLMVFAVKMCVLASRGGLQSILPVIRSPKHAGTP